MKSGWAIDASLDGQDAFLKQYSAFQQGVSQLTGIIRLAQSMENAGVSVTFTETGVAIAVKKEDQEKFAAAIGLMQQIEGRSFDGMDIPGAGTVNGFSHFVQDMFASVSVFADSITVHPENPVENLSLIAHGAALFQPKMGVLLGLLHKVNDAPRWKKVLDQGLLASTPKGLGLLQELKEAEADFMEAETAGEGKDEARKALISVKERIKAYLRSFKEKPGGLQAAYAQVRAHILAQQKTYGHILSVLAGPHGADAAQYLMLMITEKDRAEARLAALPKDVQEYLKAVGAVSERLTGVHPGQVTQGKAVRTGNGPAGFSGAVFCKRSAGYPDT